MVMTTTTATQIVGSAQNGDLVLDPVAALSLAFNPTVSTVVRITQATNAYRTPIITQDPSAAWTSEGQEIVPSDMTLDEMTITPSKVAGLSIITAELANDSNPAAAEAVGLGLARDISRQIDSAFFGNLPAPAPKGLASLPTTSGNVQTVAAGSAWTNTDPFAEALSLAEAVGATITAFVTGPTDALLMAKVKKASGSNEPLLGNDPTRPTLRVVQGVPLHVSRDVAAGTVWGLDASRNLTVVREDVDVSSDASVYYSSDRVALRAKLRCGFGFPQTASIVKITLAAAV